MEKIFTETFEQDLIQALLLSFQAKKLDFDKMGTYVVPHNKLQNSNRMEIYYLYQQAILLTDPNHYKYLKQVVVQNFRNRIISTSDLLYFWGDQIEILQENEIFAYLDPNNFQPFPLLDGFCFQHVTECKQFRKLKEACSEIEWEIAYTSIEHEGNLGLFLDDNLIGMASMINWNEIAEDIGIIIHPDYRLKNYGKMLLSEIVSAGLEKNKRMQFRFQQEDEISKKLVTRVGFKEFMRKSSSKLILQK